MAKENEEDFYKNILFNIKDGVYFVDEKRKIPYWNKGAETITGFSSNEIIGKYCFDRILINIDDANHNICEDGCPLAATIKDGQYKEANKYNANALEFLTKVLPTEKDKLKDLN